MKYSLKKEKTEINSILILYSSITFICKHRHGKYIRNAYNIKIIWSFSRRKKTYCQFKYICFNLNIIEKENTYIFFLLLISLSIFYVLRLILKYIEIESKKSTKNASVRKWNHEIKKKYKNFYDFMINHWNLDGKRRKGMKKRGHMMRW